MSNLRQVVDFHPENSIRLEDIVRCLSAPQKILPSKLFYDEHGSRLFDAICELPEYYLTRIEQSIMETSTPEVCRRIGSRVLLVELGSGSSLKTRILLDNLENPAAYIPIDISAEHLVVSAGEIAARYPTLEVMPVCADYDQEFTLPRPKATPSKTVVYFPGSTIGNFHPPDVVSFLKRIKTICGPECDILIGVDLQKDAGILHRAYNDCDGVTAAFNLNILRHLNDVYNGSFELDYFEHQAFYNVKDSRIEMHLVSLRDQTVLLQDHPVRFEEGEKIWTESSYKYTLSSFEALAVQAGFQVTQTWMDYNRFFSVQYLEPCAIPNGGSQP